MTIRVTTASGDSVLSLKGSGGEGGIRTHGNLTATRALQARLIGHSSTSPLKHTRVAVRH